MEAQKRKIYEKKGVCVVFSCVDSMDLKKSMEIFKK